VGQKIVLLDSAIEMIKHHEGVRVKPYRCPARLWTVAVGHVIDPRHALVPYEKRMELPIPEGWDRVLTMGEVNAILRRDLNRFDEGVRRLCPGVTTSGQHSALISFAFNVGLGSLQRSTLRQKVNRQEFESASEEFLKWTKAGGRELPGLVKRRKDEQALFLRP
jgi:lysozyme